MTDGLTVKIHWQNAKLVRQGLENLRAELPRIARARIFKFLRQVVSRMKRYPAKPKASTYVRTMKLKRSWRIVRDGKIGYAVSNHASFKGRVYASFVHGDWRGQSQATVHQGRWPILLDELENRLEKLPKAVAENAHTVIRRYWERAR